MTQLELPLFEKFAKGTTAEEIDWTSLSTNKKNKEEVPDCIKTIMKDTECSTILSISGGKDSQASQEFLLYLREKYGWQGELYALHCNLGRADWKFTQPFVEKQCSKAGLKLVTVKAESDLLTIIYKRYLKLKEEKRNVPHFPSPAARYCTKASKTEPTDKHLRKTGQKLIINIMGTRAQESISRAKKNPVSLRPSLCSERFAVKFCELETRKIKKYWLPVEDAYKLWLETGKKHRLAIDWLIIHEWKVEKVWEWCGTSLAEWERRRKLPDEEATKEWPASPIYVIGRGNTRKSCAYCMAGSSNDQINAIAYNPETYDWLVKNEQESGWDYQEGKPLRRFARYRVELIEGISETESEILILLYQRAMTREDIEESTNQKSCLKELNLLEKKGLVISDGEKYTINFDALIAGEE
jgi:3'-phosphoadenosine 5'-phosphosulfate sulfotransferase (PAPS reductase)/FAD synthetase